MPPETIIYSGLLTEIKNRVRKGQLLANLSANAEMLATYWDTGKLIHERQQQQGWGKGVIPKLAKDLKNDLAEMKGFSVRNIARVVAFYKEYPDFSILPMPLAELEHDTISPLPVAKLQGEAILPTALAKLETHPISPAALAKLKALIVQLPVAQLKSIEIQSQIITLVGWAQHIILIEKVKDLQTRFWYMQQTIANGWSHNALVDMIKSNLHKRQGAMVNNFDLTLPDPQSSLASQLFKDPYIFDFVTLSATFTERELELELIKHVEKFLIELGAGFAFVGRQYSLTVSDKDFSIDLLFYHLKMRCFIVIDLKRGDFIPEYAGKMNFYCSAADDQLRHPGDAPTIGLILCQGKDKLFAEYALRDINKPIGITDYELTRMLPANLQSSLPSVETIEAELNQLLQADKK
jgi:predicted nuclease of restriction endonuclease-like (RecB) superfamily